MASSIGLPRPRDGVVRLVRDEEVEGLHALSNRRTSDAMDATWTGSAVSGYPPAMMPCGTPMAAERAGHLIDEFLPMHQDAHAVAPRRRRAGDVGEHGRLAAARSAARTARDGRRG